MSRDIISVNMPEIEATQSIAYSDVVEFPINAENGVKIQNATENKNNSLSILIENVATSASSVTFVAGDTYPNSMLGNLEIPLKESAVTVCQIQDISRFENRDGSICLDFATGFTGNITVVAKRAGITPLNL